jgi:peptidoglycan/LPS O-acetylase OafA/YrhL
MSELSSQMVRPKYRPDIDGLRAVAVLRFLRFTSGGAAWPEASLASMSSLSYRVT